MMWPVAVVPLVTILVAIGCPLGRVAVNQPSWGDRMAKLDCVRIASIVASQVSAFENNDLGLGQSALDDEREGAAMSLLTQLAVAREIARAEEAIFRLLGSIETGVATGRTAEAYRAAMRRHGRTILDAGGPDALAAALNRISKAPGREAERRALLTELWAGLDGARE